MPSWKTVGKIKRDDVKGKKKTHLNSEQADYKTNEYWVPWPSSPSLGFVHYNYSTVG